MAGLARSLAFALIGGPLAALLWWGVWRRLDDETERASIGWGLYVTGMYVLSLVLATSNLLSTVATLIGGQSLQWRLSLATGWFGPPSGSGTAGCGGIPAGGRWTWLTSPRCWAATSGW